MTSPAVVRLGWQIGKFVFGALAVLAFVTMGFVLISDDFVIHGQVVPASDSRVKMWWVSLGLVGLLSTALAWFFHRQSRR